MPVTAKLHRPATLARTEDARAGARALFRLGYATEPGGPGGPGRLGFARSGDREGRGDREQFSDSDARRPGARGRRGLSTRIRPSHGLPDGRAGATERLGFADSDMRARVTVTRMDGLGVTRKDGIGVGAYREGEREGERQTDGWRERD